MFLAVVPFCFPALLFPRFILTTVFSPEYASAAPVMRIMAMYILVYSLGLIASQYVVSARMEKVYFTSVFTGGVLSVLLCLWLIPKSGAIGAALSLLIAHSVSMGLYGVGMIEHVRSHN
jgi:PST family polysaccharide transporter